MLTHRNLQEGTRIVQADGYVRIKVMGAKTSLRPNWILEHHHVMAQILGRPIAEYETVHHKNGVRDDNRPENLELWFKRHPPGQRVEELLDFVCAHYAAELKQRLT